MAVLVSFPMQDQLREPTEDGRPSENASYNCVATSTAAACRWLTGVWHSGDRLKDAIYGEAWRNSGTAERDYVGLVAKLYAPKRVVVTRRPAANQAALIGVIRASIKAGHPILISMPSAWRIPPRDPMHPGSSHCGCVYQIDDSDDGYMTVMNPWRGWADRRPVKVWRSLLCYNEGWELSLAGAAPAPAPDPNAGLPAGYKWDEKAGVLTAPNGVPMRGGIAASVRAALIAKAWQAGYPARPEQTIKDAAGLLAFQPFGSCTIIWRPGWPAPRYATDAEMASLIALGVFTPAA